MDQEYKSREAFVDALISHEFANDMLTIKFVRLQSNTCNVYFQHKVTHENNQALFSAAIDDEKIKGTMTISGRRFIINKGDGRISNPHSIIEKGNNLINYLENKLIGITGSST